jgi:hypothetical protein
MIRHADISWRADGAVWLQQFRRHMGRDPRLDGGRFLKELEGKSIPP